MGGLSSNSGEIFDLRKIRRLVELMNEHELNEIDLRKADVRIRLRRGGEAAVSGESLSPRGVRSAAASPPVAAPPVEAEPASGHVITSPMVGTFYTSSSPDAPPYVKVGDHVGPDSIVCIVEAMKVFNEIPAGVAGQIQAVLVENGEPVEYGQPLFKINPGK